ADGSIDVNVSAVTATLGPLVPGFVGNDGDDLNAFLALGGNSFRPLIETALSTQLIPTFTDRIPPLLESVLGATDKLLNNVQFTLDLGVGKPVTLQLDGSIGALDVAAGATTGRVPVRQNLALRTSGAPTHAASPGAARVDTSTGEPVLNTSGVHLLMRLDFLN